MLFRSHSQVNSGQLEFTCECLLALAADTPEAIEASYKFNKEGFCKQ